MVVVGTSATGVGVLPALPGDDGIRNSVAITATAADTPPMLTNIAGLRPGCGLTLRLPSAMSGTLGAHGRSGYAGRGGAPDGWAPDGWATPTLLDIRCTDGPDANCWPAVRAGRSGPLPLGPGPPLGRAPRRAHRAR